MRERREFVTGAGVAEDSAPADSDNAGPALGGGSFSSLRQAEMIRAIEKKTNTNRIEKTGRGLDASSMIFISLHPIF
jgi:hypothetical protein